MSDKNDERIAALEEYEREQNAPRPNYGLDEGMCELARLIGLPDTPQGILEHFRREERRRKLRSAGLVLGAVALAVAVWLMFRWLT